MLTGYRKANESAFFPIHMVDYDVPLNGLNIELINVKVGHKNIIVFFIDIRFQ